MIGETQGNVKVVESPLLINEIRFWKTALKQERVKRAKLESKHYLEILDKLAPINVSYLIGMYYKIFKFKCQ